MSDTGCSELVRGTGLNVVAAPVHRIHLFSDLRVRYMFAVRPELPVDGIQVIRGNGLAVARMWPGVLPPQCVRRKSVSNCEQR